MRSSVEYHKQEGVPERFTIGVEEILFYHKKMVLDTFLFLAEKVINDRLANNGKLVGKTRSLPIATIEYDLLITHFNRFKDGTNMKIKNCIVDQHAGSEVVKVPITKIKFSRYEVKNLIKTEKYVLPPLKTNSWHNLVFHRVSFGPEKEEICSRVDSVTFIFNHYSLMASTQFDFRNWKIASAITRGEPSIDQSRKRSYQESNEIFVFLEEQSKDKDRIPIIIEDIDFDDLNSLIKFNRVYHLYYQCLENRDDKTRSQCVSFFVQYHKWKFLHNIDVEGYTKFIVDVFFDPSINKMLPFKSFLILNH
ncbi:hypothetical protein PPL_00721 [Heterostelium album PN500]|uniref:Uncharacterized protein n=1 Tax=Heterostelium pallidum (strain ATCC 26659 / Pp 5 / PN500) TaxID=670386 RepID=D3AX90_HETP5|nr:hypothetical protein PPL_00721 [Heterostelium album PN500]EFA86159.1 hypothetical protein PPL_00721 [Heterostelium album PN500]|eukprot:XP_020438264.1 hypothetical protein PPL_00721 [Heterostelium album PN500]